MAKKPEIDPALLEQSAVYPVEAPEKVSEGRKSLTIGIPKEQELQELRACLTPASVGSLTASGHEILFQSGAGEGANFPDHMYSENGAQVVHSSKEVFEADIVLKVEPPTEQEIGYMQPKSTLMSALQYSHLDKHYLDLLQKKKITGVAFELIEDKGGLKPIIRSMSEIASSCITSIAGEYLSNSREGMGVVYGGVTGVPPVKVVILGAGTIGENVARAAKALGASVRIFDNQHYKLRRLKKDIGDQFYTSMLDPFVLADELVDADVVVGALRSEDGISPCVVTEEMVANMKKGAIIIDASISQGGCFETSRITSHEEPTFTKHGVVHYCVPNIPSRVARTATRSLSYMFTPMLNHISRFGGVDGMILNKSWFMKGVYSYHGCMTNRYLAQKFGLDYRDLSLLLAAGR